MLLLLAGDYSTLYGRFLAARSEIREDRVATNLTKILERGVWPVGDYIYILMEDMLQYTT
jgi:hypothetical protein